MCGPKIQNCQFELEFGTYTNWNMQNSMDGFTFSLSDQKYCFRANLANNSKLSV